jgi:hypothetical protein
MSIRHSFAKIMRDMTLQTRPIHIRTFFVGAVNSKKILISLTKIVVMTLFIAYYKESNDMYHEGLFRLLGLKIL